MKKEKKSERTKERILQAAMQEFGTKGYAAASVNTICSEHGISKGLLYHHFRGKDDLYLACVSRCFADLTAYLHKQAVGADLHRYMEQRFQYFSQNSLCAGVFFEAVLQPPASLAEEIKQRKKDFNQLNRSIYQMALSEMTLRPGITQTDAMEYYEILQEMFNGYFNSPAYAGKDFNTIVADHEAWLSKMLDGMLYGLVERG